jgi:hypothetical protein
VNRSNPLAASSSESCCGNGGARAIGATGSVGVHADSRHATTISRDRSRPSRMPAALSQGRSMSRDRAARIRSDRQGSTDEPTSSNGPASINPARTASATTATINKPRPPRLVRVGAWGSGATSGLFAATNPPATATVPSPARSNGGGRSTGTTNSAKAATTSASARSPRCPERVHWRTSHATVPATKSRPIAIGIAMNPGLNPKSSSGSGVYVTVNQTTNAALPRKSATNRQWMRSVAPRSVISKGVTHVARDVSRRFPDVAVPDVVSRARTCERSSLRQRR